MSKTFKKAPKPKPLTDDAISAFEQGGTGQDTKQQKHKTSLPQNNKNTKTGEGEPVQRLSIVVPESLHRRFKAACSARGKKMQPEILAFLERRTAELEKE